MTEDRYDYAPPSVYTASCGLDFMGFDFWLSVDFRYRAGSCPTWCNWMGTWDPPCDPEYEVERIVMYLDGPGGLGPAFEATGKLLRVLEVLPSVEDAMRDEVTKW